MERHFDQQLDKLKTRLIKMCSLVDEQVELAVKAVQNEDLELAKFVVERDNKVDKYDLKIDKICQKILALNQPVAMDLRLIMSAVTINSNVERIGDIAANIAHNFTLIGKKPLFAERTKFFQMAMLTREMMKNAIDSFINLDAKLAQTVIENDNLLDSLNVQNHKILIDIMKEDRETIEQAVAFLVMSRQLERIGDHSTNIAEDVYFIVEAQTIRHKYEKYFLADQDDESDELE